jgi:DNA processing protein
MNNELLYRVAITLIPGVGPVLARNLISYCGSIEQVFQEKHSRLVKIPDIGPITAKAIATQNVFQRAEEECGFIIDNKITPLFYLDKDFPQRLRNCYDSPIMVYFKGNADLNAEKIVAIVGTRSATSYGREITDQLVADFGENGAMIISGLAYGIDITAHKAAVKRNITNIGVVGHGLDRIYPSTHRATAAKMVLNGGVLTEFPSKTNPDRENFPARNRVVAGISDAVIVVESAEKGGALITAEIANGYNRDVFAVPGNINSQYSKGCNLLIKENKAALIESASDVIKMMQWETNILNEPKIKQRKLFIDLSDAEKRIVDFLADNSAVDIDVLSNQLTLTHSQSAALLLGLEIKGIIKVLPGKQLQLI